MQYECIFDYSINNYSFNNPLHGWKFLNRRAVTELDQNEFHKGLRKAQVIDVREKLIMIMVILMVLAIFQYLCLDKDFKVYVKINLYIFVMQMVLPVIVLLAF